MWPVSTETAENQALNSKAQSQFDRRTQKSKLTGNAPVRSLFQAMTVSHLTELSSHILQDIGRRIIEKRLKSWEVGAFLDDILYGLFTLWKYKAKWMDILASQVSYFSNLTRKWVSHRCFIFKQFSAEPSPRRPFFKGLKIRYSGYLSLFLNAEGLFWLVSSVLPIVFC